ncbi:MAG: glycosyltransferase family 4 protein [Petrotogales bacterium]
MNRLKHGLVLGFGLGLGLYLDLSLGLSVFLEEIFIWDFVLVRFPIMIEYICFTELNGYGIAAYNYIQALSQQLPVCLHSLDFKHSRRSAWDISGIKQEHSSKNIQIFHCIPPMQRRIKERNKYTVGFATFEAQNPPLNWIEVLNKNTAIIVPSSFCKKEFLAAGVKVPVHHIPHCIDFNRYNRDVIPSHSYDKFTFLFVGEWKQRKGYDILLQAWAKEFKPTEDVQLIIKTRNSQKVKNYCKQYESAAPIKVVGGYLAEDKMPGFLKSTDCIVMPSRGEGFGLLGIQALALNIPLIVSHCTGCRDYTNMGMTINIPIREFEYRPEMDKIRQFKDKKWAKIDVGDLRELMRYVYNNKTKVERMMLTQRFLIHNFNYEIVGQKLKKILKGNSFPAI